MNKRQARDLIKSLLKDQTDLIVEVRKLDEYEIEVDIASNMWKTESVLDRFEYCFDLFKENELLKDKTYIICPVSIEEYKEMKASEMNKSN